MYLERKNLVLFKKVKKDLEPLPFICQIKHMNVDPFILLSISLCSDLPLEYVCILKECNS